MVCDFIGYQLNGHLPERATGLSIKKALPISQKSFEDIEDTISQNCFQSYLSANSGWMWHLAR
jgi:hypothetical protein